MSLTGFDFTSHGTVGPLTLQNLLYSRFRLWLLLWFFFLKKKCAFHITHAVCTHSSRFLSPCVAKKKEFVSIAILAGKDTYHMCVCVLR